MRSVYGEEIRKEKKVRRTFTAPVAGIKEPVCARGTLRSIVRVNISCIARAPATRIAYTVYTIAVRGRGGVVLLEADARACDAVVALCAVR